MADKVDKGKKKAKPKKDEKGVLAALPSTRPERIGGRRGASAAKPAAAASATAANPAQSASSSTATAANPAQSASPSTATAANPAQSESSSTATATPARAKPKRSAAKRAAARHTASAKRSPKSSAARRKAAAPRTFEPTEAAEAAAGAADERAAGAVPRAETPPKPEREPPPKPKRERTYPRPQPVREGAPGIGTGGYRDEPSSESARPSGVELATTAVRAAGEVAQLGLTVGGEVLKRVVRRLPRP